MMPQPRRWSKATLPNKPLSRQETDVIEVARQLRTAASAVAIRARSISYCEPFAIAKSSRFHRLSAQPRLGRLNNVARKRFLSHMATDISLARDTDRRSAPLPRNLNLALAVIAAAQLMGVLDATIVNIALPSIQRALQFSPTGLEWVVNAYSLTFGGLLLLGGRAGDLFGRRRMFVVGIVLFTLGSLAGGFATSAAWLIIARAAQGIGAAIVAPTALSLIADTFAECPHRNRALGVYGAVAGAGGATGLLLGGVLTDFASWRWVLFVNVPIGILLAIMAPRVLAPSKGRDGGLDLPGALTATGGAVPLVYGLSRAATYWLADPIAPTPLRLSGALPPVLLAIQSRTPD